MVKLFFDIRIPKKNLYMIGKYGFLFTLLIFAAMLLTGIIDKQDDLKSYYNFWNSPRGSFSDVPA